MQTGNNLKKETQQKKTAAYGVTLARNNFIHLLQLPS